MKLFRNSSIKNKVTLITMLTCMVVLIVLLISFTILEFTVSRTALVEKVATLAEVIGTNSTAALTFSDQKSAEATLSALSAESEIVGAALYTRDGRLFAMYLSPQKRSGDPLSETEPGAALPGRQLPDPAGAPQGRHVFYAHYLELTKNIVLEGEVIGCVYLKSTLADLYRRLGWYVVFALSAIFPSLLIAYLLSSGLQRITSRPIMDLAQTMNWSPRRKTTRYRWRSGAKMNWVPL
jgi:Periplasmic sensor domain